MRFTTRTTRACPATTAGNGISMASGWARICSRYLETKAVLRCNSSSTRTSSATAFRNWVEMGTLAIAFVFVAKNITQGNEQPRHHTAALIRLNHHLAPCARSNLAISARPRFCAQANGVAHGSSSGRFVAAPRFNRNSTICRRRFACEGFCSSHQERTAAASGVPFHSRSRALMSAPALHRSAAMALSPFAAQKCRAVLPSQSVLFGSNPRASSMRNMAGALG